jgi:Arc/MetJ-type ribon-helix-helix transcriptional regulator
MHLSLRPEIQRFIEEQVMAGRFPSPEALVEAAVADMQYTDESDLDDATIAAINEAEEQGDRGEGIDLDTFRERMQKRFNGAR